MIQASAMAIVLALLFGGPWLVPAMCVSWFVGWMLADISIVIYDLKHGHYVDCSQER